jgi:hypothetical protein
MSQFLRMRDLAISVAPAAGPGAPLGRRQDRARARNRKREVHQWHRGAPPFSSLGPYDDLTTGGYDLHGASIRNANGDAAPAIADAIRLLTHQRRRWRDCGVFYSRQIMDMATP